MERIQPEWIEKEWVVVADVDPARYLSLAKNLEGIGFRREKIVHARDYDYQK